MTMSRTKKGGKPPGYEWWGTRPGAGLYSPYGSKFGKRQTHKAERVADRINGDPEQYWKAEIAEFRTWPKLDCKPDDFEPEPFV